jgi:hypothetical protein
MYINNNNESMSRDGSKWGSLLGPGGRLKAKERRLASGNLEKKKEEGRGGKVSEM